jgi:glycosyltransferase involved in cell wall biosynthesis
MFHQAPLVSVIVPVYNGAATIRTSLQSVFAQSWKAFECIVVDDGSTDGTGEIIRATWPQVKVIHQQNQGVSAARNNGIRHASGTLLAFQDADDYWMPGKLEAQVKVFSENPDVVLVNTGVTFRVRDFDTTAAAIDGSLQNNGYEIFSDLGELLKNPFLATPSVMVRTDVAREVGGFDRSLICAEDVDFYFRVCHQRKYAKLDRNLTLIGALEDSLGSRMRSYPDCLFVLERFRQMHPEIFESNPDIDKAAKIRTFVSWIDDLIYRGQGREARRVIREASKIGEVPNRSTLIRKSLYCWIVAKLKQRSRSMKGLYT